MKTIRQQCRQVFQFLERARDLILDKCLIPSDPKYIDEYEKASGKKIPSDYRYWLTKFGSGYIDHVNGSIDIPSVSDLIKNEEDGRLYSDSPADSWKRISLGYAGAPCLLALDTTIIDGNGCCPVIKTLPYCDTVWKVYASSWPMYLIYKLLALSRDSAYHYEQLTEAISAGATETALELSLTEFAVIDTGLIHAGKRIRSHNNTKAGDNKTKEKVMEAATNVFKQLLDSGNEPASCKNINQALKLIDRDRANGNSNINYEAESFIENQTKKKDMNTLYDLLDHPVRQTRRSALEALKRILKDRKMPKRLENFMYKTPDLQLMETILMWIRRR